MTKIKSWFANQIFLVSYLQRTLYIHTVMKEALMYLLDSSQSLSSSEESSESCSPSLLCSSSFLIGTRLKSSAWDRVTVTPHCCSDNSIWAGLTLCHHPPATSRESQLLFYYWWRWPHTWWLGFPYGLFALFSELSTGKKFIYSLWTVSIPEFVILLPGVHLSLWLVEEGQETEYWFWKALAKHVMTSSVLSGRKPEASEKGGLIEEHYELLHLG